MRAGVWLSKCSNDHGIPSDCELEILQPLSQRQSVRCTRNSRHKSNHTFSLPRDRLCVTTETCSPNYAQNEPESRGKLPRVSVKEKNNPDFLFYFTFLLCPSSTQSMSRVTWLLDLMEQASEIKASDRIVRLRQEYRQQ